MSTDIRAEFPVTDRWAFFNHANVAPISRRARERLCAWATDASFNGDRYLDRWLNEIESVRNSVAQFLGASIDEVAFLKNTTEGVSLIAEGFPWEPGDNVVIARDEYPSNVYPWMHLATKGVEIRFVSPTGCRFDAFDIEKVADSRTRIVSVSYVQFVSGFRADLRAIGAYCRERGVDFFVDAIQGLGVLPLDVSEIPVDYICANSHKWLVSPVGAAVLFIRRDKIEKIRPTSVGWKSVADAHSYSRIDFRFRDDAGRFECGSLSIPNILALGASLSLFHDVGISAISQSVKHITDELVGRLDESGAEILSPRNVNEWSGIVSFRMPAIDARQAVARCAERGVLIGERGTWLRASLHFYNNKEDIDRLVGVLQELRTQS